MLVGNNNACIVNDLAMIEHEDPWSTLSTAIPGGRLPGPANRILVATSRNRLLGLLVDTVHEVVRLDRHAQEQPPADVMTDFSDYITAVYRHRDDLLILMDLESVLLIPKTLAAS